MNNLKQLKQELEKTKNKCAEIEKKIKELEIKVRWRAREGEKYYYFCGHGEICADRDGPYKIDTGRYNLGNYFKTEEEAENVVEKIKIYTQLKDLALRLNRGKKMDWNNSAQSKWCIILGFFNNTFGCSCIYTRPEIGQIYCLDGNFLKEAKREIGEENLKKLFE